MENLKIGDIFYDEANRSIGEVIAKDGKAFVAKFYNIYTSKDANISYGKVVSNHLIVGKNPILQALDSEVRCAEIRLEELEKLQSREKISKNIRSAVNKRLIQNSKLGDEIFNIQKKQDIEYSESRQKQISCILKKIRRNMKYIRGIERRVAVRPGQYGIWTATLSQRKMVRDFVKKM